jgi:hypothetical protein
LAFITHQDLLPGTEEYPAHHDPVAPSVEITVEQLNRIAQCFVDPGDWTVCQLHAEAERLDEIELPFDNCDTWVSTAITLLDKLIQHCDCPNIVFEAAYYQYHLASHSAVFAGNPAAIVHAFDRRVAQLIISGNDLFKLADPSFTISGFSRPYWLNILEHAATALDPKSAAEDSSSRC